MKRTRKIKYRWKTQFNSGVWRNILQLINPYRIRYIGLFCVIGLLAGVETAMPLAVKYAIDNGISTGNIRGVYHAGAFYLFLVTAQAVCISIFIIGCGRLGARVMSDIRSCTFDRIQNLSIDYFDKNSSGWILSRILSDSQRVGDTLSWGAVDFLWGIVTMLLMAAAMCVVHFKLALAVLCLIPLILYVSVRFQKLMLRVFRKARRYNSKITAGYSEGIAGVKVIKTLCREEKSSQEFGKLADSMYSASFRSSILASMYLPVVHILGALGCAIVLRLGGQGVITGSITLGTLVAFISYAQRFFDPANDIARLFGQLQETQASAERLFALIHTQPSVISPENGIKDRQIKGNIEFCHVHLSYDRDSEVLHDINFNTEPGRIVALVGATGSGKTSIASLIMRFYDVSSGSLKIDGIDIRQYDLKFLRSHIGCVLQTPHLFSGTIKDNIRYGRLDANEQQIIEAARSVGLHDFVLTFPDQYDTQIKEGGEPLSTGQKQLVSLARAVLANPAIFIMDEATSSVDTETEYKIQKAIGSILKGRTSFIIAHRLTTIRQADTILVIDKGRIAESGTHRQLLNRNGIYYQLYCQQFLRLSPLEAA